MHESTPKALWLQELRRLKLRPILEELEDATTDSDWELREQFWIEVLGPENLLNQTPGGLGQRGMSAEMRAKIGASCRGKNLGNSNAKGSIISAERRQAIRERLQGKERDPATKAKISEGLRRYHAGGSA